MFVLVEKRHQHRGFVTWEFEALLELDIAEAQRLYWEPEYRCNVIVSKKTRRLGVGAKHEG